MFAENCHVEISRRDSDVLIEGVETAWSIEPCGKLDRQEDIVETLSPLKGRGNHAYALRSLLQVHEHFILLILYLFNCISDGAFSS